MKKQIRERMKMATEFDKKYLKKFVNNEKAVIDEIWEYFLKEDDEVKYEQWKDKFLKAVKELENKPKRTTKKNQS